ncbi:MAG: 5-deoxy-glucuronate isomerase [Actinomycetia bacterium]|nr:5-deoxy-glucuronate isomerase [Actinomycetes bacterium]
MSQDADRARWVWPAGSRSQGPASVVLDDSDAGRVAGWEHTGLIVTTVTAETPFTRELDGWEAVVLPLTGAVEVWVDGVSFVLRGRSTVFDGPTDVAYAPNGSRLVVGGPSGPSGPGSEEGAAASQVAICLARVAGAPDESLAPACLRAQDVPVEVRGAGAATRLVRNVAVPGSLAAQRIIACEVITPAGNWSSWPPHKHDEERPGEETELEEIYYFETRPIEGRAVNPVGYQRVYGTEDRPIDVLAEVRSGDVVLVPHGWHGPSIAAPDADLYYLNVMAGPGPERAWRICDDPAHGWVREQWDGMSLDPRVEGGEFR